MTADTGTGGGVREGFSSYPRFLLLSEQAKAERGCLRIGPCAGVSINVFAGSSSLRAGAALASFAVASRSAASYAESGNDLPQGSHADRGRECNRCEAGRECASHVSSGAKDSGRARWTDAARARVFGLTRWNAELLSPSQFRIGIAEVQGDRRPEFRYCAHRLYGDTVAPTRARGLVSYPKG